MCLVDMVSTYAGVSGFDAVQSVCNPVCSLSAAMRLLFDACVCCFVFFRQLRRLAILMRFDRKAL